MVHPSSQTLNAYVMEVLKIEPEDLEANRNGMISPRQQLNYRQMSSQNVQGLQRYMLVVPVIIVLALIREVWLKGGNPFAGLFIGFDWNLLVGFGATVLLMVAVTIFSLRRYSSLGRQRLLMVEGSAKLDIAGAGTYQLQAVVAATGMDSMRGRLRIGNQTFRVSESILRGFQPGAIYRAYYVKLGTIPVLIGAEAVAPAGS